MAQVKAVPQAHKIETVPPPVGGINAKDPINLMPESDAVNLVNWIPDTYGLRCRKGFREWAINFPEGEIIGSILSYIAPGTPIPGDTFLSAPTTMPGKLFACSDEAIYDITDATDAPASAQALSGNADAGIFSSTIVSNTAGTFLCAVSETDGYFTYDGTSWVKRVAGASAGQINGVDPDDLCYVLSWKKRLWFVERNSTSAWYLDTDAIAGTATEFDFGSEFKKGGFLSYLANWTIDAGEGVDDFLVAVSSMGEVLLYKGSDPDTAGQFLRVGSFFIGQVPVGRRGHVQYGGDLALLSANGIYPLSFVTRGGSGLLQATGQEYSSNIRSPLGEDLRNSFNIQGWSMVLHPSERILIIGVPDYGGQRSRQYVMSTTQNKWTTFEGIPAYCYGECLGYTFAGSTDGRVLLLFTDFFDDVAYDQSEGTGIRCVSQPAFSYFKSPALNKQFLAVRASFLSNDRPSNIIRMAVDFDVQQPQGTPTPAVPEQGFLWDTALWDAAQWAGGTRRYSNWQTVGGVGFAGAANMVTVCTSATTMTAIDYMFQSGGPMG